MLIKFVLRTPETDDKDDRRERKAIFVRRSLAQSTRIFSRFSFTARRARKIDEKLLRRFESNHRVDRKLVV